MSKIKFCLLLLVFSTFTVGCGMANGEDNVKTKIAVGIVPQKEFVEKVAGDLVDVVTMIPPGYSPTNYQPTPKEMIDFSESQIYFLMGLNSENAYILPRAEELKEKMKVINLREEVKKVYPLIHLDEDEDLDHDHGDVDPHIWLSPKNAIIIVKTIESNLKEIDPENSKIYEENANNYIDELKKLDQDLMKTFENMTGEKVIMYHPAYGYFARDYGIEIVTIEEHGKEATIQRIKEVVDLARSEHIKYVFYQEEFDSNQANTIAKEIGGEVIKVSPLSKDYIASLYDVGEKFKRK